MNQVGRLYPGLFYAVMGAFATTNVETSVFLVRMANVALVAALLFGTLYLAPAGLSRATALVVATVFAPLAWFIVASTNPSSWAIAASATLWVSAYAVVSGGSSSTGRRVAIWSVFLLSAVMLVGSRSDGAIFAVASCAVATLLWWFRSHEHSWRRLWPLALLSLASCALYFYQRQFVFLEETATVQRSLRLAAENFLGFLTLYQGALGSTPVGWLDAPLPPNSSVLILVALSILGAYGLGQVEMGKSAALVLLTTLMVMVPLTLLQQFGAKAGSLAAWGPLVQPRYVLPVLVMFVGVLLLSKSDGVPLQIPRGVVIAAGVMLYVAAVTSFWYVGHRYAFGDDSGPMDLGPLAWQGLGGVSFYVAFTCAVVGYAVLLVWLLAWQRAGEEPPRPVVSVDVSSDSPES